MNKNLEAIIEETLGLIRDSDSFRSGMDEEEILASVLNDLLDDGEIMPRVDEKIDDMEEGGEEE